MKCDVGTSSLTGVNFRFQQDTDFLFNTPSTSVQFGSTETRYGVTFCPEFSCGVDYPRGSTTGTVFSEVVRLGITPNLSNTLTDLTFMYAQNATIYNMCDIVVPEGVVNFTLFDSQRVQMDADMPMFNISFPSTLEYFQIFQATYKGYCPRIDCVLDFSKSTNLTLSRIYDTAFVNNAIILPSDGNVNFISGDNVVVYHESFNSPIENMQSVINGAYLLYGNDNYPHHIVPDWNYWDSVPTNLYKLENGAAMFGRQQMLTDHAFELPNIVDGASMFDMCTNFNAPVTLGNNIDNCYRMFCLCRSFNQEIYIPQSVTNAQLMFAQCTSMYSPIHMPASLVNDDLGWSQQATAQIVPY